MRDTTATTLNIIIIKFKYYNCDNYYNTTYHACPAYRFVAKTLTQCVQRFQMQMNIPT